MVYIKMREVSRKDNVFFTQDNRLKEGDIITIFNEVFTEDEFGEPCQALVESADIEKFTATPFKKDGFKDLNISRLKVLYTSRRI
jgi:hypothetical protein